MKIDSGGKTGRLGRGDYWGGTLMMVIGLWAAYAGTTYDIGTLQRMGPGFFPVALGVILTLVGAGIAVTPGNRISTPGGILGRLPELRAWILILGAIAAFVVVGRYGGLSRPPRGPLTAEHRLQLDADLQRALDYFRRESVT